MEVIQAKMVIMDIVESSFGPWRGVTVDNIFVLAALAEELFKKSQPFGRHALQQTGETTGISSAL